MMTRIQTLRLVSLLAMGAWAGACSSGKVAAAAPEQDPMVHAQPAETQAASDAPQAKVSAPVQVTLTSSASAGQAVITLSVQPESDIPRAVARIVLPQGIRLVSGQTEVDLGALKKGAPSQIQVTVEIPSSGQFQIFAGVDCHITSGIRLHKGARTLVLGQSSPAP